MDTVNVKELVMGSNEKPETCLIVSDNEVTVERVLSLEQQKQFDEEKTQEEARLDAAKKDNKRERGLQDMMGGVLEVKKEDILKHVRLVWLLINRLLLLSIVFVVPVMSLVLSLLQFFPRIFMLDNSSS